MKNNVLLISPEPWSGHWVSKHHYAKSLVDAGASVYFLEPPSLTEKRFNVCQAEGMDGIYVLSCKRVFPALQYMPAFIRCWIERGWLSFLENFLNVHFDTIWLFENSRFFDMRFAGDRLKIYHQVDLNQDFHPLKAVKTADVALCTSNAIANILAQSGKQVYKVNHGVAITNCDAEHLPESPKINDSDINAVYVGNLDIAYLDLSLLQEVIATHPNVVFHLVGNYSLSGSTYTMLRKYLNVRWWGRVSSSGVASILQKMDICLLVYKSEEYRDQLSNPHKLMEYLASGAVCVATYTDEYKDYPCLLQMAERREDYLPLFNEVVKNLDQHNSPGSKALRKCFAESNSYPKQLQRIEDILVASGCSRTIMRGKDD
ncbi:glycosyltransferase [Alcanivorax sp.]|uniref:glycosyltransferase n=1 Tax=Alcanivorax sp. TaxID=1872427 RepID=UPI0025B80601|nr:glycosyltransferase [Alcanivorax sp.]